MPAKGVRLHDEDESNGTSHQESALRHRMQATALLLASMLIVPFMDACAKVLVTAHIPVIQVVWLRVAVQMVIAGTLAVCRHGVKRVVCARHLHLLVGRGALLLAATCGFFAGIKYIPLADAIAITFIEPALLLVLSVIFLREKVPPIRWAAVSVCFGAALLIVKPGASSFQPASLIVALSALFFSCYILATRLLLRRKDPPPPLVLLAHQAVAGGLGLAPPAWFIWRDLSSPAHIAEALAMGAIGTCSHLLLILAFDRAPAASFLAPLLYTEIIMQTVLGYLCFGDFPDPLSLAGIGLIITVGCYLSLAPAHEDESTKAKASELATPPVVECNQRPIGVEASGSAPQTTANDGEVQETP